MKNYACDYTRHCGSFAKDDCQGCPKATNTATALMAEADMAVHTSHDAVFALAMNHDPATLIVGNTRLKVLITDVDSSVSPECAPDIKLRCQVVDGAARASFADRFTPEEKAMLNATYGKTPVFADLLKKATAAGQTVAIMNGQRGNTGKAYFRNETILAATFAIDRVYFNDPVTVVLWKDGTKTIVRCQEGDTYSAETGLALCFAKKALGNKGNFNNVFKKFVPEKKVETEETPVEVVEAV